MAPLMLGRAVLVRREAGLGSAFVGVLDAGAVIRVVDRCTVGLLAKGRTVQRISFRRCDGGEPERGWITEEAESVFTADTRGALAPLDDYLRAKATREVLSDSEEEVMPPGPSPTGGMSPSPRRGTEEIAPASAAGFLHDDPDDLETGLAQLEQEIEHEVIEAQERDSEHQQLKAPAPGHEPSLASDTEVPAAAAAAQTIQSGQTVHLKSVTAVVIQLLRAQKRARLLVGGHRKVWMGHHGERGLCHAGPGAIAVERRGVRIIFALMHHAVGRLHVVGGMKYKHWGQPENEGTLAKLRRLSAEWVGGEDIDFDSDEIPDSDSDNECVVSGGDGGEYSRARNDGDEQTGVGKHPADGKASDRKDLRVLEAAGHSIACFGVHATLDVAFTAGTDGSVIAWNFKGGTQLWHNTNAHATRVTSMSIAGNVIYTGGQDSTVRALSIEGDVMWTFRWHYVPKVVRSRVTAPTLLRQLSHVIVNNVDQAFGAPEQRASYHHTIGQRVKCARSRIARYALSEEVEQLLRHDATLLIGGIKGHLEDEEALAKLLSKHPQCRKVIAVTIVYRFDGAKVSYALVSFSDAEQATRISPKKIGAGAIGKKVQRLEILDEKGVNRAEGLTVSTLNIDALEASSGLMRQAVRQHAEQLDIYLRNDADGDFEAPPVLAASIGTPIIICEVVRFQLQQTDPITREIKWCCKIVACSTDASVCCMDCHGPDSDGNVEWVFNGHSGSVQAMCSSSNAGDISQMVKVYCASSDGTVRALQVSDPSLNESDRQLWCFDAEAGGMKAVCLSRNQQVLFSGGWDGAIRAIDTERGNLLWSIRSSSLVCSPVPSAGGIMSLCASSVFDIICFGTSEGVTGGLGQAKFPPEFGQPLQTVTPLWTNAAAGGVTSLACAGGVLYTGSSDRAGKFTRAFELATGASRWNLTWQDGHVADLQHSQNIVYIASDNTLKALDKATGAPVWNQSFVLGRHAGAEGANLSNSAFQAIKCVSVAADQIFVGSSDDTVRAVDAQSGTEKWCFSGHKGSVRVVCQDTRPGKSRIYTGSGDTTVRCIDTTDGFERGHERQLWKFGAEENCKKSKWALLIDEVMISQRPHINKVTHLAFTEIPAAHERSKSAGDALVFSGSWDSTVRCLSADTGFQRWAYNGFSGEISCLVAAADCTAVFAAASDKTVQAINASTGEQLWEMIEPTAPVSTIHISGPADRRAELGARVVYTCSRLRTAGKPLSVMRALNFDTGEEMCKCNFSVEPVSVLEWTDYIIVGFKDGHIRSLSKRELKTEVCITGHHTEAVRHLVADAKHLYSAASTGEVVLTRLDMLQRMIVLSGPLSYLNGSEGSFILRFKAFKLPLVDLLGRSVVILYTTVQLSSFAFSKFTVSGSNNAIVELLSLVNLNLTSTGLFFFTYTVTVILVLIMLWVFARQEKWEWREFIRPDLNWRGQLWLLASFFCQGCTTVLFIPVCQSLARGVDCTHDLVSGRYWLDSTLHDESPIECWVGAHWLLAVVSVPLWICFVLLSSRLIMANSELRNIEAVRNPLDWSGDSRKLLPYVHVLSPRSSVYLSGEVAFKCAVVLVSTFIGDKHPNSTVNFMLLASLALLVLTLRHPPYFGPSSGADLNQADLLCSFANRLRCALDLVMVYCYTCASIAAFVNTNLTAANDESSAAGDDIVQNDVIMLVIFPLGAPVAALIGYTLIPTYIYGRNMLWQASSMSNSAKHKRD